MTNPQSAIAYNTIKEKRWLEPDELEVYAGIKRKNQDKLRMMKKIPFSKIGRYVRYDRHQIDAWLEKHRVETAEA